MVLLGLSGTDFVVPMQSPEMLLSVACLCTPAAIVLTNHEFSRLPPSMKASAVAGRGVAAAGNQRSSLPKR